jgi:hypothetical protein
MDVICGAAAAWLARMKTKAAERMKGERFIGLPPWTAHSCVILVCWPVESNSPWCRILSKLQAISYLPGTELDVQADVLKISRRVGVEKPERRLLSRCAKRGCRI